MSSKSIKKSSSTKSFTSAASTSKSSTSGQTVAVGIDLGTYNARVAYFDEDYLNHPVVANNNDGRRTTRVVMSAELTDDSNTSNVNKNNNTVPVTVTNLDQFLNEEIIPLAHDAAHTKDVSVIVSIPNDDPNDDDGTMLEEYLKVLQQSGKRGVITEAAAICLAYDLDKEATNNRRILVVDGGASGLKIALLRATSNGLWCLESTQKTQSVTGEALVETLGQAVAQQFEIKNRFPRGEVWQSKKARTKLQKACENGLTTLQINNTLTIHVESLYEGIDCSVTIGKGKWDHLSSKIVNNAKTFLKEIAAKAAATASSSSTDNNDNDNNNNIDTVLLSGNMHTWLKPMIQSIFPGKLLSSNNIDPAEAICIGCTIQANWNLNHPQQEEDLLESIIESSNNSKNSENMMIPTTLDVPMSPIAIAIGCIMNNNGNRRPRNNDTIVIDTGTPLPALVNYEFLPPKLEEQKEEEENSLPSSIEIWQVKPTEKHLATLSDMTKPSTIRMLLTESKKLRIAVGEETIVIG